ncbi:MAG: hypothetical protein PHT07_20960 [Paludibacter sp.]|nr:hypothetical protein [Paludibacter sp.]
MSQIAKLNYGVKTNPVGVTDRSKQATAEDFNEIKTVVNDCVDGINWIKSDEAALSVGVNHILFLAAYPVGLPYVIVVHNAYDSRGYLLSHTITNKTKDGFDVTVASAGTFLYLTVPKR